MLLYYFGGIICFKSKHFGKSTLVLQFSGCATFETSINSHLRGHDGCQRL